MSLAARRWLAFVLTLLGPFMLLAMWEIASRAEAINPLFFPPPTQLWETADQLIASGELWQHVRASLRRILLGFAVAAAPGVALGLMMGLWWPVRALLNPIAAALFAIPKIAILPLVIIIFGIGETSKVAMVAISVIFLVVLSTMSAVMDVDQAYFDVARNAGAGPLETLRTVAFPGALPGIFSGLRIALGFSLLVIVGTEFLAAKNGIGYLIWNSYQTFSIEKMYIGLVVTALLGWLFNLLMDEIERVVIPWRSAPVALPRIPLPERVHEWFMATRPFSFTASIIPVLIGTLLAAYDGAFDLGRFCLVIVASVLVHAGSNLVNDYFDHVNGADKPAALGRGGAIQRGVIPPRGILVFGLVLFAIATVIGLWIVYITGWQILLFAVPSLLAAYFYTGGPKPLGYIALGEVTVFLFMGPMLVVGSYYVQAETISWAAALASLPVGLLVTAILQANNIRDIQDDTEAGKRTLATFIGRRWANREYVVLVVSAYLVLAVITLGGVLPALVLIAFVTIPRAIETARIVLHRDEARLLNAALRMTAGLHLRFGLLMSAALLLTIWF